MQWFEKLREPFPMYLNDDRKNTVFILIVSLFVVFFLHVYRPYHEQHIDLTTPQQFLFGGVTFVILYFHIVVLPKIFPNAFDPLTWTVGKHVLLTLLHMVVIGVVSTAIDELYLRPDRTLWDNFKGANMQVVLTGILPITIIFLFLKNNMLQQNLQTALEANQELEKLKSLKKDTAEEDTLPMVVTLQSETSETLTLNLLELLFIEANDNYSTVVWKSGADVQKKLLRANLKNIETQINHSFTIRCHRSYIVNVHAISNISGNTNGYKLQILDTEHFIPVSRPKGKEVIEKIQQLRNVMELA